MICIVLVVFYLVNFMMNYFIVSFGVVGEIDMMDIYVFVGVNEDGESYFLFFFVDFWCGIDVSEGIVLFVKMFVNSFGGIVQVFM